jgi:cellulose synthase/poly-beta-1,6-N-acetylglucosamine synthase-like glycosyltransferase
MSTDLVLFLVWAALLGMVYYVFHGYLLLLQIIGFLARAKQQNRQYQFAPSVTILLTVHNEQQRIVQRIENLLALEYTAERLEIVVASDGSTDRTNEIVCQIRDTRVPLRLLTFDRIGKSEAQNRALLHAKGDIVAFVDADCSFAPDYLGELVRPFAEDSVGCATAALQMKPGANGVARSQGYYWKYETELRRLESRLGLLCVASGQAMAVRRSAFVQLPSDVGEDCMIPLDTVLQGLRCVYVENANAWDSMDSDPAQEFRARVRMTLRNWNGTWRRSALLNPSRYPRYAFALWSHKIARWLSPFFLIAAALLSLPLMRDHYFWPAPLFTLTFLGLAVAGWISRRGKIGLPVVENVYSFCLANAGFLVGVSRALVGDTIVHYGSTQKRN